jgi:hypothetical protein
MPENFDFLGSAIKLYNHAASYLDLPERIYMSIGTRTYIRSKDGC